MANPSGDSFSIDANTTLPFGPSGDSFSIDAYVGMAMPVNPAAIMSVDANVGLVYPVSPIAVAAVDLNLTNTQSPARLKIWDGNAWIPLRLYYWNPTTQAWVQNT